jgi:hypothetical protein
MPTRFSARIGVATRLRRCCSAFTIPGATTAGTSSTPVGDGEIGYARFRFSYRSTLPESDGRPVMFEGISRFRLAGGLIAHYDEAFDRGVALVQLGFPAERIRRIVEKAAAAQNGSPEARAHLDRFGA